MKRRALEFLFTCFLAFSCTGTTVAQAEELSDSLPMNHLQVIGSHNSYKEVIDPELLDLMKKFRPTAWKLEYSHASLTDQLNLGLRNLELDLFHDPEGGRYAKPAGITLAQGAGKQTRPYDSEGLMQEPGFKVLHMVDFDFRSNCPTLKLAMTELREWSEANPRHLPIMLTFNLNDGAIDVPGATEPAVYDAEALDQLDKAFLDFLGRENILMPDDVRGECETLREAVTEKGWPNLKETRGHFFLVLDQSGHKKKTYTEDHPSLRGRVMFTNCDPQEDEAAVMIRNNPREQLEEIQSLVKQGFLVRTRSDANTVEARENDFTRFEAAKKSGAQVITTDYYLADPKLNPDFRIRFDTGECVRMNPLMSNQLN